MRPAVTPRFEPILYRDFYDVPRMFVVRRGGTSLLFDGSFDDTLDDYPDFYEVYELPPLAAEQLAESWRDLAGRAVRRLGRVAVADVRFDATRRKSVDLSGVDVRGRVAS